MATKKARKTHQLKCQLKSFNAILSGEKVHEIRNNDRDYRIGDVLVLREWDEEKQQYTGRELVKEVSFMSKPNPLHGHLRLEDLVVMSIKDVRIQL